MHWLQVESWLESIHQHLLGPGDKSNPEQKRPKQIKRKKELILVYLVTQNVWQAMGDTRYIFLFKSVASILLLKGYYLHLQKSEDQAQPKSCRCDTKSSQKVSTILVNSTKIVSNNILPFEWFSNFNEMFDDEKGMPNAALTIVDDDTSKVGGCFCFCRGIYQGR